MVEDRLAESVGQMGLFGMRAATKANVRTTAAAKDAGQGQALLIALLGIFGNCLRLCGRPACRREESTESGWPRGQRRAAAADQPA